MTVIKDHPNQSEGCYVQITLGWLFLVSIVGDELGSELSYRTVCARKHVVSERASSQRRERVGLPFLF